MIEISMTKTETEGHYQTGFVLNFEDLDFDIVCGLRLEDSTDLRLTP